MKYNNIGDDLLSLPGGLSIKRQESVEYIVSEIWDDHCYDKSISINPGDVVVDLGANQGIFSLYAAQKGATVYAVEPDIANYKSLLENIEINNFQRKIIPFNFAISYVNGNIDLFVPKSNIDSASGLITTNVAVCNSFSRLNIDEVEKITVKSYRFSDFLELIDRVNIDLLKIDCEGAELEILSSGDTDDFINIEKITMETHGGYTEKDLYSMVKLLGFHVVEYNKVEGKFSTGSLCAVKSLESNHQLYKTPVAIFNTPLECLESDKPELDASLSFSTDSSFPDLQYVWSVDNVVVSNGELIKFELERLQRGCHKISLKVVSGEFSSFTEKYLWVFSDDYSAIDSRDKIPVAFGEDQNIQHSGLQHFVLDENTIPGYWDYTAVHLSLKVTEWDALPSLSSVIFYFDGQSFSFDKNQKTIDFPCFPRTSRLNFSIYSDEPVELILKCYADVGSTPDLTEIQCMDISESRVLSRPEMPYICSIDSAVNLTIDTACLGTWTPNKIKLGVSSLAPSDLETSKPMLSGSIVFDDFKTNLSGWYKEIEQTRCLESGKYQLAFDGLNNGVYKLVWWPE